MDSEGRNSQLNYYYRNRDRCINYQKEYYWKHRNDIRRKQNRYFKIYYNHGLLKSTILKQAEMRNAGTQRATTPKYIDRIVVSF
jgi:hypothetical protein